jgi:anti-sigma-K factor RskA
MLTPDDRILAAELVLGLLDDAERASALERLLAEPDFAVEVQWWRGKLAPLLADYESASAPVDLSATVERLLEERPVAAPVRRRTWPVAIAAAFGGAIAASLALMVATPSAPPPQPTPRPSAPVKRTLLIAPLASTGKGEGKVAPLAVVVDRGDGVLRVAGTIAVPRGRSAELWRIGANGVPVALGVLPSAGVPRVDVRRASLPLAEETIAVSIEPQGGAPGAAPTGPVIATGVLETI